MAEHCSSTIRNHTPDRSCAMRAHVWREMQPEEGFCLQRLEAQTCLSRVTARRWRTWSGCCSWRRRSGGSARRPTPRRCGGRRTRLPSPPTFFPHPYSHPRAPLSPAPFAVGERAAGAGERGQTERDGQSLPDLTRAKVAVGGVFRFRPRRAKARRA